MKDSSIKNFLTTKRLLDQDRKSLHRDASAKSLSRASLKLRVPDELQSDISPTRQRRFDQIDKNYTQYEEEDRYDPPRPRGSRDPQQPRETKDLPLSPSYADPELKRSALWSGITNVDNAFSSSKQESKQVLDSLSRKVQTQIRVFDNTIEDYRARLRRTFEAEYQKFKESIHEMVERSFRRFEQEMRDTFLEEEARLNREVYASRASLDALSRTIEDMKGQMNTPGWKKTAGEILSTDFVGRTEQELADNADKLQLVDLGLAVNLHKREAFGEILNDLVHAKVERERRTLGSG